MRSKRIWPLASLALGFAALIASPTEARADVTRLRVSIDDLPKQDKRLEIDSKSAVLPNGAKAYGPTPKGWRELQQDDNQIEGGHCTDDRRGSVSTIYSGKTTTMKIWEANGKTWLDEAELDVSGGIISVMHATRVPLGRITDGMWGYRAEKRVVLVAAQDNAFFQEGSFWECRVTETEIAAPAGTAILDSSPSTANEVIKDVVKRNTEPGQKPKWQPAWVGVEFRALASVSKASTDATPMLNLVIKKP